jgi:hypothetical protein
LRQPIPLLGCNARPGITIGAISRQEITRDRLLPPVYAWTAPGPCISRVYAYLASVVSDLRKAGGNLHIQTPLSRPGYHSAQPVSIAQYETKKQRAANERSGLTASRTRQSSRWEGERGSITTARHAASRQPAPRLPRRRGSTYRRPSYCKSDLRVGVLLALPHARHERAPCISGERQCRPRPVGGVANHDRVT